jgi:hypothetical protein
MYRSNIDETKYSDSRYIAWELVFPYTHTPLLDTDFSDVENVMKKLKQIFTKEELKIARSRYVSSN